MSFAVKIVVGVFLAHRSGM